MTGNLNCPANSSPISKPSRCSIVELSPAISDRACRYLHGVVSLIWPYSSYTCRMAILLAEPDFRVRREKGQTKITFHGGSASAIASFGLGIGDTVRLNLDGAQWMPPDEHVMTGEKRADWDLDYSGKLLMYISRGGDRVAVVDFSGEKEVDGVLQSKATDGEQGSSRGEQGNIRGAWSSPASAKISSPLWSPLPGLSRSLLVDVQGSPVHRPKKRARFARDSGSWLYIAQSPISDTEIGALHHSPVADRSDDTAASHVEVEQKPDLRDDEAAVQSPLKKSDSPLKPSYSTKFPPNPRSEDLMSAPPITDDIVRSIPERESDSSKAYIEEQSVQLEISAPGELKLPASELTASQIQILSSSTPSIADLNDRSAPTAGSSTHTFDEHTELLSRAEHGSDSLLSEVRLGTTSPLAVSEYHITQSAINRSTGSEEEYASQSVATVIDLTSAAGDSAKSVDKKIDLGLTPASVELSPITTDPTQSASRSSVFEFLNDSPSEPKSGSGARIFNDFAQSSANPIQSFRSDPPASFGAADQSVNLSRARSADESMDEKCSPLESDSSAEHLFDKKCPAEQTGSELNALPEQQSHHSMDHAGGIGHAAEDVDHVFESLPSPDDERGEPEVGLHVEQTRNKAYAASSVTSHHEYYDGAHEDDGISLMVRSDNSSTNDIERESLPQTQDEAATGIAANISSDSNPPREAYASLEDDQEGVLLKNDSGHSQKNDLRLVLKSTKLPSSTRIDEGHKACRVSEHNEDEDSAADQKSTDEDVKLDHKKFDYRQQNPIEPKLSLAQSNEVFSSQPRSFLGEESPEIPAKVEQRISKPLAVSVPPANQLATPENTQTDLQASQIQRLEEMAQLEQPPSELPLTPQATQNTMDDQILEKDQGKEVAEGAKHGPELQLEESREAEKITSPHPLIRRSSRLSQSASLLGKGPLTSLSPYFEPRRSSQAKLSRAVPPPIYRPASDAAPVGIDVEVVIPPAPRQSPPLETHKQREELSAPETPLPEEGRLPKGLTTTHSYYTPSASIPDHFNNMVDVLAVVKTAPIKPRRAKSGPKDFYMSLKIVDISCRDALAVRLFRPRQNALPECRTGDVLLLRDMKVQTRQSSGSKTRRSLKGSIDGMTLLSTEGSAWAVFEYSSHDRNPLENGGSASGDSAVSVQVNGPPVEFGDEERAFAEQLNKWWMESEPNTRPDLSTKISNATAAEAGGERVEEAEDESEHLHEHELRDGMAYGDIISPMPLHEHLQGDAKSHSHSRNHSRTDTAAAAAAAEETALHQHTLRDGTSYSDVSATISSPVLKPDQR